MELFHCWLRLSGNSNKVDQDTGLTGRQKKLVQQTWRSLGKYPVATGVSLMIGFFKKYPDHLKQFPAFLHLSLEELKINKQFEAHCGNIVSNLSNIVDAINEPELMVALLESLAEKHKKRGQKIQHFEDLKIVTLEVLKESLGKSYTREVEEAWNKTLDGAFNVILKTLSN